MREANSGFLIDHSAEEFVAAVVSLLGNKRLYENYSQARMTYAANFDWNILMDKAYHYVLHILEGS
jgi:hypothetical protein